MDEILKSLRADWEAKHSEATAIVNDEKSTPELVTKATTLFDERDALGVKIEAREAELDRAAKLKSRATAGEDFMGQPVRKLPFGGSQPETKGAKGRIETGQSELDKLEATGGFKGVGHFAWCVAKGGLRHDGEESAVKSLKSWTELQRKAPTGMFEESDPDGGHLVPRQFSNQIYKRMVESNALLARLNPIPLSGNTISLLALKENSRVDGSRQGGVLGYWQGEADQYTGSRAKYRDLSLKLHKLTVLQYCTEELLNDSPQAIESIIGQYAANEINFKINDAVIRGDGVGKPKGILNSGSKITVSAVSGQGATTFIYPNVVSMFARVTAGQRKSMVALYNQDVEPQLHLLYMPTGTSAGVAIFTPNTDGSFNLMGRQAVVTEQCETLGTAGDVIFFATDGYACATKGGVDSAMSMHLRFDYDELAFKWRFRFDGQPYDDVALTPYKGSNTTSSIVVLNSTRT